MKRHKPQHPEDLARLRLWLKKKKISILQLAATMEYTRTYVSLVVNGKKPMYNNFIDTMKVALCEWLSCTGGDVEKLLKPLRY